MFDTLRQWLDDITQDKRVVFLMGLVAFGAVAILLASGTFGIEFGQLFARGDCYDESEIQCRGDTVYRCEMDGEVGTWMFDYDCATNGEECSVSQGGCVPAGQGEGSSTTPCTPVTPTGWGGFPPSVTVGNNACRELANPPVTPPPVPVGWQPWAERNNTLTPGQPYDCFGFTIDGEGNNEWISIDATRGGSIQPGKKTYTIKGTVFNNCPWPVEMSLGAAGHPTAGSDPIYNDDGSIDPPEPPADLDHIMTRVAPAIGTRIPSCWNWRHVQSTTTAPSDTSAEPADPIERPRQEPPPRERQRDTLEPSLIRQIANSEALELFYSLFGSHAYAQAPAAVADDPSAECSVPYEAKIDISGFNAGRIDASLGWIHWDGKGTDKPGGASQQDAYGITINFGVNCSAAPGQSCAGFGAGGGTYGAGPSREECEDGNPWDDQPEGYEGTFQDLDVGTQRKCNDAHQACYSVWPQRKYFKVRACMAGEPWSYNGMSDQEWGAYIQGWNSWIEENCGGWEDGSTSLDELLASYDEFLAPFHAMEIEGAAEEGGKQFNDEGITSVCRCPKGESFSFHYFYCNTTNTEYSCEKPTLACFEGGDVNNPEIEACAQFGYIDRDEDGRCEPPGSETPVACGDGTCSDDSETCANCEEDCGTCPVAVCGDGACTGGESCTTCDEDCGICTDTCGDDECDGSETCGTCAADCGSCATTTRTPTPRPVTVTITPTPRTGGTGSGTGGTGTGGTGTGGQVGTAATTPTGPGEVTVLALLLAGLTALLYVSYTHTDTFKHREARRLGEEQDPMDFRQ